MAAKARVVVIGPGSNGKTKLVSALLGGGGGKEEEGASPCVMTLPSGSKAELIDTPGYRSHRPLALAGMAQANIALLVVHVSSVAGSYVRVKEEEQMAHLIPDFVVAAKALGVQRFVVALNVTGLDSEAHQGRHSTAKQFLRQTLLEYLGEKAKKMPIVTVTSEGDNVLKRADTGFDPSSKPMSLAEALDYVVAKLKADKESGGAGKQVSEAAVQLLIQTPSRISDDDDFTFFSKTDTTGTPCTIASVKQLVGPRGPMPYEGVASKGQMLDCTLDFESKITVGAKRVGFVLCRDNFIVAVGSTK